MSKIALKANDSGTGTFEIQVPATNTNRVLELPDEAGKILTDVSDIEPQVKTATNASGAAPIYACRAWVNFNGTTSPGTIRASGNVSSVTRNGEGDYAVNFMTAMPDANYCANATLGDILPDFTDVRFISTQRNSYTTNSIKIAVQIRQGGSTATTANDRTVINVAIFR